MTIEYTMFGYDDDYNPTVATNVTADSNRERFERDAAGSCSPMRPATEDTRLTCAQARAVTSRYGCTSG